MNKTITIENYDPKVHVCEACRDTDTHCCGEPCRTCLVNMALSDGGRTINWQPREPEWVPGVGDRFTSSDGRECEVVAIRGATICCYDGAAFVQTTAEYWVKGAVNIRRAEQKPLWQRLRLGMRTNMGVVTGFHRRGQSVDVWFEDGDMGGQMTFTLAELEARVEVVE